MSSLAVNDVCFDEKIKYFVYLLERRKTRGKKREMEKHKFSAFQSSFKWFGSVKFLAIAGKLLKKC